MEMPPEQVAAAQEVRPPKVTQYNPMQVKVEGDSENVALVCFLPTEVITVAFPDAAWRAIVSEVERLKSGIVLPEQGIILP